ncbi:Cytochrome P450 [Mycena indigotica]|uniref:Cytochrome P450 n=1 Tax=Mycena indigotica TaxID=2126181 RepID=A0A8H6W6K0_9AGAR|nr:Cytochrome P450 [Mycena indigotica]KAF7303498.1 Cytochrome P450 [Mycena indigotica]
MHPSAPCCLPFLSATMDTTDFKTPLVAALILGVAVSLFRAQQREWARDKAVPAVGNAAHNPLAYYLDLVRFLGDARGMLAAAYAKNPTGVVRFPTMFRWEYVANGAKHAAEIAAVSDDVLSFHDAVSDQLQIMWTMGPILVHPWHINAVRTSMTRNLGRCFPAVRDEIVHSFDDVLGLRGTEWTTLPFLPAAMQIVSRVSNRMFVGLPLCLPEPRFCAAEHRLHHFRLRARPDPQDVPRVHEAARLSPSPCHSTPDELSRIVAPLLSSRKRSLRYALKFLGPILQERIDAENACVQDRKDRPNDLISWLLEHCPADQRNPANLAMRILAINMAAIHTSSTTLTSALFDLTVHPEYIAPLREEAERVVNKEGWTKAALGSMHKIDSFLRESQRLSGTGPVSMGRKVVAREGFSFADGTHIPCGAVVNMAGWSSHTDPAHYENPLEFDAFRFSGMREADADRKSPTKLFARQMVSTNPEHIVFGHGRHACPGRFFAATELKAMLAHMLIEYDVEAVVPGEAGRPRDVEFALLRMPSMSGEVRIRRREKV